MNRNFTVVLTDDEAAKVQSLIANFGGTVGGFAASLVRDFLHLTPDQIRTAREQLRALAAENRTASEKGRAERTPGRGR